MIIYVEFEHVETGIWVEAQVRVYTGTLDLEDEIVALDATDRDGGELSKYIIVGMEQQAIDLARKKFEESRQNY